MVRRDNMKTAQRIALVFTILGAVNWALIGLFDLNLVTLIFGEGTMLTRIIYILIGLCGLFNVYCLFCS